MSQPQPTFGNLLNTRPVAAPKAKQGPALFKSAKKIREVRASVNTKPEDYVEPLMPGEIKLDFHGKLYQKYLEENALNAPFIESFNLWIREGIPKTFLNRKIPFRENNMTIPYGYFSFTEILYSRKQGTKVNTLLTPDLARKYGETYSVIVSGKYTYIPNMHFYLQHGISEGFNVEDKTKCGSLTQNQITHFKQLQTFLLSHSNTRVNIGEVPIMLGSTWDLNFKPSGEIEEISDYCSAEPGCIFVIKGSEKFINGDGGLRQNRINTFAIKEKKGGVKSINRSNIVSQIICTTDHFVNDKTYNPFRFPKTTKSVQVFEKYLVEKTSPTIEVTLDFFYSVKKSLKTNTKKSNISLNVYSVFHALENYMFKIQESISNIKDKILPKRILQNGSLITDFIISFLPEGTNEEVRKKVVFKLGMSQLMFDKGSNDNEQGSESFYHNNFKILFDSLAGVEVDDKLRDEIFSDTNSQNRKKYYDYMVEQMEEDLFGNMNKAESGTVEHIKQIYKKLSLLAIMINRTILTILNVVPAENRDDLGVQRVYISSRYMSSLFTSLWNMVVNGTTYLKPEDKNREGQAYKTPEALFSKMKELLGGDKVNGLFISEYTSSFNGLWGTKKSKYKEQVAEHVKREHSILQIHANIRKLSSQIDKKTKSQEARESDEFFVNCICMTDTIEGEGCGIIRNLAILCYPSLPSDDVTIFEALERRNDLSLTRDEIRTRINPFIIDGKFEGYCNGPEVEKFLRDGKRKGQFGKFIGIIFAREEKILYVFTDAYRMTAPLLVVEDGKLVLSRLTENQLKQAKWSDIAAMGAVEYVDAYEQHSIYIAPTIESLNDRHRSMEELQIKINIKEKILKSITGENGVAHIPSSSLRNMGFVTKTRAEAEKDLLEAKKELNRYRDIYRVRTYTHCEIDPTQILSISAATIPYSNQNHGPRNTFQCLALTEKILMADGETFVTMKDIRDGDEILTIDPSSGEISRTQIYNKFIKKSDSGLGPKLSTRVESASLFCLVTIDGREIFATNDHPFLTNKGFVRLDELDPSEHKVAILTWPVTDIKQRILDVDDWENVISGSKNHAFVSIAKIEAQANPILVGDFTTLSENHTFITQHGFITHNCGMAKQEIGINHPRYPNRMDPQSKILAYPSRPLAETMIARSIGQDKYPSGMMLNVAIMCTREAQEDSIEMNRRCIDMGAGLVTKYFTKNHKIKENKVNQTIFKELTEIQKSDNTFIMEIQKGEYIGLLPELYGKPGYEALGEDGLPRVKEHPYLNPNDKFLGTFKVVYSGGQISFIDTSPKIGLYEKGIIDRFEVIRLADNSTIIRVKIRYTQYIIEGDKIASRSAQKATLANIVNDEDMPFVAYGPNRGMRPDIIFNSNSLPSRMTIGKIMEMVWSKDASFSGQRANATSFRHQNKDLLMRNFRSYGMNRYGNDILFSGITGEALSSQVESGAESPSGLGSRFFNKVENGLGLESSSSSRFFNKVENGFSAQIFMGPCKISNLKHQIEGKGQARGTTGEVDPITRAPLKGRSKSQGLKTGEMERDAMVAHQAVSILDDALCERSDKTISAFCKAVKDGKVCSTIKIISKTEIQENTPTNQMKCERCGEVGQFVAVRFPYAFYYLQNVLAGMNIRLKATI